MQVPGGEIFTALQSGVIDATEWVGPYNDLAFGLHKAAKYYYYPGWHEPGTTLESLINRDAYDALPADLQSIVMNACKAVNLDMLEALGVRTKTVCSLGGGAQYDFWLQIKADVLNRKIVTVDTEEATCLGAAILASVAAGAYSSLDEAVAGMVRHRNCFVPDKHAVETYVETYQKYLELNRLLLPTFGDIQ